MQTGAVLDASGRLAWLTMGLWLAILGSLLLHGACARNSAGASSSNAVCTEAGWKVTVVQKTSRVLRMRAIWHWTAALRHPILSYCKMWDMQTCTVSGHTRSKAAAYERAESLDSQCPSPRTVASYLSRVNVALA